MKRIALDTSVAGYFLVLAPTVGQERAWHDAQDLRRAKDLKICVPAPALAELLAWIPEGKAKETWAAFRQRIEALPLDAIAAKIAGELWNRRRPRKQRPSAQPVGVGKQCLKVDTEIVACAVRWEVDGFCSLEYSQISAFSEKEPSLLAGGPSIFLPGGQPSLPLPQGPPKPVE